MKSKIQFLVVALSLTLPFTAPGQGTFQNLDFENGTFVPMLGDPYDQVQFNPAMPGWVGYLGTQ